MELGGLWGMKGGRFISSTANLENKKVQKLKAH